MMITWNFSLCASLSSSLPLGLKNMEGTLNIETIINISREHRISSLVKHYISNKQLRWNGCKIVQNHEGAYVNLSSFTFLFLIADKKITFSP